MKEKVETHSTQATPGTEFDKQKCLRCGELRFLQETECVHKWGKTDQRSIIAMNGNIQAVIDILTCEKCGEMKEFRTAAVQR